MLTGVEVTIGESVAHDVIAEYGQPIRLPDQEQERIDKVFANIVNQADRKEITYTLTILQSDVVNAFAAPGGYVFLTTGLLRHVADDTDILANVIGHEVAHIELKHGMNTITRQLGMGLLFQLVLGGSDKVLRTVVAVAAELTRLGWSRNKSTNPTTSASDWRPPPATIPTAWCAFRGVASARGAGVALLGVHAHPPPYL